MSFLIVFCTCPDMDTAEALASTLVAERLAACVSLWPGVRSVYRWQGAVERAEEVQLLIKTTRERLPALRATLVAQHPYEVPELIAVEAVAGLESYLAWIAAATAPGPDALR